MAAEAKTVTAPGTISPKVFWPLLVGVALTFAASFLSAITPEMLSWLGPAALPMAFALGTVSQTIVAYMKSDELRDLGVQATAAVLAVEPTSQVTPEVLADAESSSEPASVPSSRELTLSEELAARDRA